MFRLVTLLLIGFLTLFSAPRAGMVHEMSEAKMTGATQTVATAAQHGVDHHEMCPDCTHTTSDAAPMDGPCPHGAICVLFTPGLSLDYTVSRVLQPVGFPRVPTAKIMARAPTMDLPPPRIGVSLA